jgi:hypothetical protein
MELVHVTVGTAYEDGVFTVGFADKDSLGALLFSLSDTTDEQHALLGMDSYCVSTAEGAAFYGGVESVKVEGRELGLRLTPEAADVLSQPRELLLRFEDVAAANLACEGLRRVGVAALRT